MTLWLVTEDDAAGTRGSDAEAARIIVAALEEAAEVMPLDSQYRALALRSAARWKLLTIEI